MSTLTQSAAVWLREEFDGFNRVLGGAFAKIAVQRQAKADVFVRPYLARLPRTELAAMGFAPAEIEKIKAVSAQALPYRL